MLGRFNDMICRKNLGYSFVKVPIHVEFQYFLNLVAWVEGVLVVIECEE